MKLNKEQIKKINSYLIGNGINYWDVRLEMIDHLASKLEENDKLVVDRHVLVKEFGSFYKIQQSLKEKRKQINNKYKTLYFNEFINFFRSPKNILILIPVFFIYYELYKRIEVNLFIKLNMVLFSIHLLLIVISSIKTGFKKNNSIHLDYARSYSFFTFFLFSFLYQVINPNGLIEVTTHTQGIVFLIITPIFLILNYCSYKVYYKTHKEYTRIYNELQSI